MIYAYSIYDNDLQLSNQPFFCSDDKSAIRTTRNMLLSAPDSILSKVLSVTELRCVGAFDEVRCVFVPDFDYPRVVCKLSDIPIPVQEVAHNENS